MSDVATYAVYLPLDRRTAMAQGGILPDRSQGATLFADISGFTPLTEALANRFGARRGADELTKRLNGVYNVLIAEVHRFGGSVIGFSGDAISCWFDEKSVGEGGKKGGEAAARAVGAALALQQAMRQFAAWEIVPGVTVTLTIKTAVAAGPVRRFLVGDAQIQVIDVLAGTLMDRVAAAEQLAGEGELIVDEATAHLLAHTLPVHEWRSAETGTRFAVCHTAAAPNSATHPLPPLPQASLLPLAQLRPWLLPAVYARLANQHDRFLAELRPAAALFVKFGGIDYDHDAEAGEKLDAYIRWVQSVLARYEGALIQLTTGDKGSYFYAAFGAPVAHDDDIQRAVAVALELSGAAPRGAPPPFAYITGVQMGIAQGRMRVGAYGSETRRTYGVLGDATNLAARLMSAAAPGQILTTQAVANEIQFAYVLEELGLRTFKGKTEPQPVYNVLQRQLQPASRLQPESTTHLVGRDAELTQIDALMAQVAQSQSGHILRIVGEAGVGKSLLAATVAQRATEQGLLPIVGACQSINRDTAWFPIRQMGRALLRLPASPLAPSAAEQQTQIEQATELIEWMNPEWLLRLPLLGDLLGLPIADNPTTAAFDAQLRREALIALALEIVQTRARAQPLLLLLEDAHWMDEASQAIMLALGRVIMDAPILLVLVQRPPTPDNERFLGEVAALSPQTHLPLTELAPAGVAALVANRLGSEQIAPLALALVQALTQGNPFYTEELLDALQDAERLLPFRGNWTLSHDLINHLQKAGCLTRVNSEWTLRADAPLSAVELGIPDSIHGIVLARLDRLPEPVKLTIKAASIIGRIFELDLLAAVHPHAPAQPQLLAELDLLLARDFARIETPEPQRSYIFKHNITQEVVYRTLLEEQRQDLHGAVGQALEQLQPEQSERLAYHFYNGDLSQPVVRQNALRYLGMAGDRAQREYANETALTYYDRALGLEVRWPWLKSKIEVLHILGRRDEERETIAQLAATAAAPAREAALLWSDYYESISDYPQAQQAADRGLTLARADNDTASQARFLAKLGMIAWRQGDYDGAEASYQQALGVLGAGAESGADEAEIRYGLGLVYRQQGKYVEAEQTFTQTLAIYRERGDGQNEARLLEALGHVAHLRRDIEQAIEHYQQSLQIRESIGDRAGVGAGLVGLAQGLSGLGDYGKAEPLLLQALQIQKALGNRWWEILASNELGILYMMVGQWQKAEAFLGSGLQISREIGDDSGITYILCNLGQVLREQGKMDEAQAILSQGLQMAKQQGDPLAEAVYWGDLAIVNLKCHHYLEAIKQAEASLELFLTLDLVSSTTANLTTLALASQELDSAKESLDYAHKAFHILDNTEIEKPDFPQREYWICSQVFQEHGDLQIAADAFQSAYQLLMEQANRISDLEMRQSFLENVPHNREIMQAAKRGGFMRTTRMRLL